jgi:hypothetical protein
VFTYDTYTFTYIPYQHRFKPPWKVYTSQDDPIFRDLTWRSFCQHQNLVESRHLWYCVNVNFNVNFLKICQDNVLYLVSDPCNKITQIFCDPLFSNVREVGRDLSIFSHSHNTCASVRFRDTMDTGLVISQPSGLETMLGFPSPSTHMQVASDLKGTSN